MLGLVALMLTLIGSHDQVTYRFYLGRLHMFDDKYKLVRHTGLYCAQLPCAAPSLASHPCLRATGRHTALVGSDPLPQGQHSKQAVRCHATTYHNTTQHTRCSTADPPPPCCLLLDARLILQNLIPVRLQLGYLPTDALLKKYDLEQFVGIAQAMRTGNIKLFQKVRCMLAELG